MMILENVKILEAKSNLIQIEVNMQIWLGKK